MKLTMNCLMIVILVVCTAELALAQIPASASGKETGIATLFARDPLTQSVCLKDGGAGGVFHNGQTKNRCSDLNFNSYLANAFRVGVEGGREGVIVDLGTPEELKGKYGYQETVGNGQGFASIAIGNGKALILNNYKEGTLQPLAESVRLFEKPTSSLASAPVKIGHIYLMRVTDRNDESYEMFAKILVLAYTPGESVTVRWHLLSDSKIAKL
ncbi:MAG TPA: hypothetical protein VNA22_00155 [Pyrinomonadaceae bacterium]|nr:hypothetical protein [Pyrinomonadaceae bacterium]